MCLILFAYRAHPRYRLIIAANRDEWFRRPAAAAQFWADLPHVFAGRDLEQGGTWMGLSRTGRFAALTNYREPSSRNPSAPTRGKLVSEYLAIGSDPIRYLESLQADADRYNGFSLLLGDVADGHGTLGYFSNREGNVTALSPGIYGLSNHLLETPWPKVVEGKRRLGKLVESEVHAEALLALLDDTTLAAEAHLPDTGISLEWEHRLSAMRIITDGYGTRCSTAIIVGEDGTVEYAERTFDVEGRATGTVFERFPLDGATDAASS